MSLLNQVLRDLQGRQASLPEQTLSTEVRPVLVTNNKMYWLSGLCLMLVAGFALTGLLTLQRQPEEKASSTQDVSQVVTVSPPHAIDESRVGVQGNRLAAVRLSEEPDSLRLMLEFSQPLKEQPQVFLEGKNLRVLLPNLLPVAQQLPQPREGSKVLKGMKLLQRDHLWQLLATFSTEVKVKQLRLAADRLHGERLALDISAVPSVREKTLVSAPPPTPAPASASAKVVASLPPARGKAATLAKKSVQPSTEERVQHYYLSGLTAMKEAHTDKAVRLWQQALKLDPTHLELRQQLILALLGVDRPLANALFTEGLLLHDQVELRKWYARALLPIAGARAAAKVLASAAGNVADEDFLALRAGLWQQAGEYLRAEQDYVELISLFPKKSLYHFGLAVSLDQQVQPATATEQYRLAMTLGLKPELQQYAQSRLDGLRSARGAED